MRACGSSERRSSRKSVPARIERCEIRARQRIELAPMRPAAMPAQDRFDQREEKFVFVFVIAMHGDRAAFAALKRRQPRVVGCDAAHFDREKHIGTVRFDGADHFAQRRRAVLRAGTWNSISLKRTGRSVESSFQPSSTASSGFVRATPQHEMGRRPAQRRSRIRTDCAASSALRETAKSVSGPRGRGGSSVSSCVMLAARPVNGTA